MPAAGDVIVVGTDHGPEGLVAVPVDAVRSHRHPRLRPVHPSPPTRLVLIGVEDEVVDAHGEGPVGLVLHVGGVVRVAMPGHDVKASARTTGRPVVWAIETASTQLYTVSTPGPQNSQRNVGHRAEFDIASGVHIIGLVRVVQAVLVRVAADRGDVFSIMSSWAVLRRSQRNRSVFSREPTRRPV